MSGFIFPPHYSLPPFFTLQPAPEVRLQQIMIWSDLVVKYCTHHEIVELIIDSAADMPLFKNDELPRQLDKNSIVEVLEYVSTYGHGAWMADDKSIFAFSKTRIAVVANEIYKWADKYGLIGNVSTLAEIGTGSESRGESFNGLPECILFNALKFLEASNRGILFPGDSLQEMGIKFLPQV